MVPFPCGQVPSPTAVKRMERGVITASPDAVEPELCSKTAGDGVEVLFLQKSLSDERRALMVGALKWAEESEGTVRRYHLRGSVWALSREPAVVKVLIAEIKHLG